MLDYQDNVEEIQEVDEENQSLFEPIEKEPEKPSIDWVAEIKELIITFAVCYAIVAILTTFVVKPVRVEGNSMYPTLLDQEVGAVNMLLVKLEGIERYDVVVVHNDNQDENWVKRVIGMPGDTIFCKNDVVYVNGEAIDEPYLNEEYVKETRNKNGYFTYDFDEVTLGDDEYFLMGDNRVVSLDSRAVGPFKGEQIIGKDAYILFPFNQMKIVRNSY